MNYILDQNDNPVAEPDLLKWADWFEKNDRHVGKDQIGTVLVSTVFLSVDHDFDRTGQPVLWETMVFGGKLDEEVDRCSGSREQAEAMHARMVERVKASYALNETDA